MAGEARSAQSSRWHDVPGAVGPFRCDDRGLSPDLQSGCAVDNEVCGCQICSFWRLHSENGHMRWSPVCVGRHHGCRLLPRRRKKVFSLRTLGIQAPKIGIQQRPRLVRTEDCVELMQQVLVAETVEPLLSSCRAETRAKHMVACRHKSSNNMLDGFEDCGVTGHGGALPR